MLCNFIPTHREINTTILKKVNGGNKLHIEVKHFTQLL